MRHLYPVMKMVAAAGLVLLAAGAGQASTRKGDKFLSDGRKAEQAKDYDRALELYEKAVATDPGDNGYQLAAKRVRFQAGEKHVGLGLQLRRQGKLVEALSEFERAYALDPSSTVAEQEVKRTAEMIERNKKGNLKPEEQALTPEQLAKREEQEEVSRIEPPPELKPISSNPINLKMTNQPPKVLFETVGKLAGLNVVFDPEYGNDATGGRRPISVELTNSTLEDALDYLSTMTHSFWKPISSNGIFVTQDTPNKRRDFESSVVRVFYLTNLTTPQELQEISSAVRTICVINKVFLYNSMNALIVRGTPDQVLLAQKLVNDLDKPKSEVVVDVIVMEADRTRSRNLASALGSLGSSGTITPGINSQIAFTPRNPVLLGGDTSNNNNNNNNNSGNNNTTGTTTQLMSLGRIGHLSTNDFSITLPGALLQAVMSDSTTKVLQSPQVRAASGQKATLRIGDKVPIATGGLQPFGGTVGGFSSLYNQFTFQDVGVNVDITPTVHGNGEVTLKVMLDISQVRDHVDIGGISQPIIGQRKVEHEIRIRQGEVSLLGGLMQTQDTKSKSGIPGLASIPGLGHLFSSDSITRSDQELLIALIPHVVRTPGITDVNLRAIAAGTDSNVRLSLTPRPAQPAEAQPPVATPGVTAPAPSQPVVGAPVPAPPAQPTTPVAPPAVPTSLLFRPPKAEVRPGSTFTLQFDAENARDLFAAPFHLKFDPQVLRLQEIRPGPLLSNDGGKIIFTRNILNDSGDATVNLTRLPGSPGVNGSGTLVVFTFEAVKPGTTVVTFSDLGARNSQMQPVSSQMPHAEITIK